MKATGRIGASIVAVLALVFLPSAAEAFSWWKLDKLSGPKFQGVLLQLRAFCLPGDSDGQGDIRGAAVQESAQDPPQKEEPKEGEDGALEIPQDDRTVTVFAMVPGGVVHSFCGKTPRRRASLDVNVGWLRAERDVRFAGNHRIHAISAGPSFSFRANEVFEFGTAAHLAWFFSNGMRPFGKAMIEPIRVDVRFLKDSYRWDQNADPVWWQEAFFVRGGYVWFPKGFDDGDFGAPADGDNAVPYVGVEVDFDYIRRHFEWW